MSVVTEVPVPIDITLRFVLFALECGLGHTMSAPAAEQVFRDALADQVSAKEYLFHESRGLSVTGRVDEYEPEMIWIQVCGTAGAAALLRRIADSAN